MKVSFRRQLTFVATASLLAACGGGGGGGGSTFTPAGPPPASPPTAVPSVVAQGSLIDHESGSPLAGVPVAVAPWTAGATPVPQGTTAPNGAFSVVAAPGKYLLYIGSDSATDPNNRPTIHDAITLTAGTATSPQSLVAPTMPPMPSSAPPGFTGTWFVPTPPSSELSGKYRLTTLSAMEQSCLAYENQVRVGKGYAKVVSDEWLTENQRIYWLQDSTNNAHGATGYSFLTNYGTTGSANATTCIALIDLSFSWQSLSVLANPAVQWFDGEAGGNTPVSEVEAMYDPRAPLPQATPPNPWP